MSVLVSTGLINPALRIAGITGRPQRTPAPDQSTEALGILIRMVASWNVARLPIYTRSITSYLFTTSKKSYTIGLSGADFTAAPPLDITRANILFPTSPVYRSAVKILDDREWAEIRLEDIPNIIPKKLYPNYTWPLTTLNLVGQPIVGYSLELDCAVRVQTFVAITDTVVLPDGYEKAIVYNLAVEIAAANPHQANLAPGAPAIASQALSIIESRNAPVPKLKNDAAGLSGQSRSGDSRWWLTGGY